MTSGRGSDRRVIGLPASGHGRRSGTAAPSLGTGCAFRTLASKQHPRQRTLRWGYDLPDSNGRGWAAPAPHKAHRCAEGGRSPSRHSPYNPGRNMNQTVAVNSPSASAPPETPWVEVYGSRGLPDWLERQSLGLAFTTYQTGKLFLVGRHADRPARRLRAHLQSRHGPVRRRPDALAELPLPALALREHAPRRASSTRATTASTSRASATPPATSTSTTSPSRTPAASSSSPPLAAAWPRSAQRAASAALAAARSSASWPRRTAAISTAWPCATARPAT